MRSVRGTITGIVDESRGIIVDALMISRRVIGIRKHDEARVGNRKMVWGYNTGARSEMDILIRWTALLIIHRTARRNKVAGRGWCIVGNCHDACLSYISKKTFRRARGASGSPISHIRPDRPKFQVEWCLITESSIRRLENAAKANARRLAENTDAVLWLTTIAALQRVAPQCAIASAKCPKVSRTPHLT
jgi:hypothetical protein